jgi:hypothetical protein
LVEPQTPSSTTLYIFYSFWLNLKPHHLPHSIYFLIVFGWTSNPIIYHTIYFLSVYYNSEKKMTEWFFSHICHSVYMTFTWFFTLICNGKYFNIVKTVSDTKIHQYKFKYYSHFHILFKMLCLCNTSFHV